MNATYSKNKFKMTKDLLTQTNCTLLRDGIVVVVKVYKVGWIDPVTLRRCDLKWQEEFFVQFLISSSATIAMLEDCATRTEAPIKTERTEILECY